MIQPEFLKRGDTIAIISTARKIGRDEIDPAIKIFESWGLKVKLGEHLFDIDHQFAGDDDARVSDLQSALDDTSVKAIICARGGYGTVRLIDKIDFTSLIEKPKWICGYSDVTVLQNHVNGVLNIKTIHSTMPINFAENSKESIDTLKKSLFGEKLDYGSQNYELIKPGIVKGSMIGGNLSIIYSLLGSKSQIDPSGKILFIEDIDEMLYHLDRMLMALDRAGMFKNLKALVVGGMTDMRDNTKEFGFQSDNPFGKNAREIILERMNKYKFPIVWGFPSGHSDHNLAWISGGEVNLK